MNQQISLSEEITYRPIPQILSDLKSIQKEELKIDKELDQIFKKLKPQVQVRK